MQYKWFLDGNEYQDPGGWNDLVNSIARDKTKNGILATIDGTFTFTGDAYTYLRSQFNSQGYCFLVECRVLVSCDQGNTYTVFYEGIIFLTDIKFNELKCEAAVKIEDDSFYAKINNSKSVSALLHVPKSKSGDTINAATLVQAEFFDPTTGNYYTNVGTHGGAAYTVFEAFKFLVAFMTDGAVSFASDTFGPGGDWEGLVLTNGKVLKNVQAGMSQTQFESGWPLFSFDTLFTEVHKKINIGFIIEKAGASVTLRIETKDYFYQTASAVQFSDIGSITTSTAVDQIYSKMKVGSSTVNDDGALSFNENQLFLGFKEEEYHIVEPCNIDSTLDLLSGWVISSNVIEDAVVGLNDAYDEDIFLIKTTVQSGVYLCEQSNWLTGTPPPYFYNEVLTNSRVTERFFSSLPAAIAIFLSAVDNTFEATKSANDVAGQPATGTFDFDTEINDPGSNYNPATFRYTAQSQGTHSFSVNAPFSIMNPVPPNQVSYNMVLYINRYDSLNNLLTQTQIDSTSGAGFGGAVTMQGTGGIFMNISDYATITYSKSGTGVLRKLSGGHFKCTATPDAGGIVTDYDPADYPIIRHEFEHPLSYTDFKTILADPKKLLTFAMDGQPNRSGWIESIKYNSFKGTAKFILNSSQNLNR